MKKRIDLYNYPTQLLSAIKSVENASISDQNKQVIFKFRDECVLEGIGIVRTIRYLGFLRNTAQILNVDFDNATVDDIKRVVQIIEGNQQHAAWTKSTYKIMLKRFYRWLKQTKKNTYPPEVEWISTRIKRSEMKLPNENDLLSEDDIRLLVKYAEHPRDKALVSVLYESGTRVGELASLQIGDVRVDEYGAVLYVTGKTGPRPVRIISSVPHLMGWINAHPFRDDPGAPLWIKIGTRGRNDSVKYSTVRKLLKDLFAKAGLRKCSHPHFFRHSRATFLANHLTEFQMNQYFGWVQGSGMPSTYVHMSGKNLDQSILRLNGASQEQTTKTSILAPIDCPRCETVNAHDSQFCSKCGGVTRAETAIKLQVATMQEKQQRDSTDQMLGILMKDPEFKNMMVRKVRELDLASHVS